MNSAAERKTPVIQSISQTVFFDSIQKAFSFENKMPVGKINILPLENDWH